MAFSSFHLHIDAGTGAERLAMLRKALEVTGRVELDSEAAARFTGEAHGKVFGDLMIHAVKADPIRMIRDRPWVRAVTRDMIFVNLVTEGRMTGRYRGRAYRVEKGSLTVSRLSTETDVVLPRGRIALGVPKALLDRRMTWRGPLDGRVFPSSSPVTVLLERHFEGLLALSDLSHADQHRVSSATLDLMANLLTGSISRDTPPEPTKDDLNRRVRGYILAQLGDPELNATTISRAFELSPSQLGRLLGKGFNLAESIRRMRLHKAYQDLLAGGPGTTVKAVATRWGIPDDRTFRRTFHAEFKQSPSAVSKRDAVDPRVTARIAQEMAQLEAWFTGHH